MDEVAEPAESTDHEPPTRRQRILDLLENEQRTFEGLQRELRIPLNVLVNDLRHLEKSLRRTNARLRSEPAACADCGFVFRDREVRHFTVPGRCPKCRSAHIHPARLRVQ